MKNKFCFPFISCIIFSIVEGNISNAQTHLRPAIYDIERLNNLRQEYLTGDLEWPDLKSEADKEAASKPTTVMNKKRSFIVDKHYYCSLSIYSWPSEDDSSVYIIKDGQMNPEQKDYNRSDLVIMSNRLKTLSVAYYITHDKKYCDAILRQLNAWMLDKETYMYPNMIYAQVQPGFNNNLGMSYGLVELNLFTPIIESYFLVQSVEKLNWRTRRGVRRWFKELLRWTLDSEQWKEVSHSNNNIETGLYVTLAEMARLTKDKKTLKQLVTQYKDEILNSQIDDEGKQPAELKRTLGFGYSVGNLYNIVDFCLILEQSGLHFYKDNQERIDSAFEYLAQFVDNHDEFPYQQLYGWDNEEKKLCKNIRRLERMESNKKMHLDSINLNKRNTKQSIIEYVY